jgi:hypothetical protein
LAVWGFRLFALLAIVVIAFLAWAGLQGGLTQPTPIEPTLLALATIVAQPATPSATTEARPSLGNLLTNDALRDAHLLSS